jgi:hypothetical protein
MVFDSGIVVKEVVFVVRIEERFIAPKPRDGAEYLSARATPSQEANAKKSRRLAPLGMTG